MKAKPDFDRQLRNEAELPPGIDVPPPPRNSEKISIETDLTPDVERDIRELAKRVGGMARLRDIVEEMEHKNR